MVKSKRHRAVLAFLGIPLAFAPAIAVRAAPPDDAASPAAREDVASAIPAEPLLIPRRRPPDAQRPPFAPPSAFVNIRLSQALGDDMKNVSDTLARYPFVRIAEPADYLLTTHPEFTQTLMLVDPAAGEESLVRESAGFSAAGYTRPALALGNLTLRDYDRQLDDALQAAGRAKALLAAETPADTAQVMLCVRPTRVSVPSDCRWPAAGGTPPPSRAPIHLEFNQSLLLAVRNTGATPRFLYLLGVEPDGRVRQFPLAGDGRVAPGAWAESNAARWNVTLGNARYRFVAIASDTPLSDADLGRWLGDRPGTSGCTGSEPAGRCDQTGPPAAPDGGTPKDRSVSTFDFALQGPSVGYVGNGFNVPRFEAPWAVQIYATVPYTDKEIAADDVAPPGTRKFLRQRSPVERAHSCGGTLIADNLVLTAAHCVASGIFAGESNGPLVFKRRRVRAGTHQLGADGTTYAIESVAVHAGYQPDRAGSPDDIALLKLAGDRGTRALRAGAALPIRPTAQARTAGEPVAVYGWGITAVVGANANWVGSDAQNLNHNPDQLQYGYMQTLAWKTCKARLNTLLGNRMLCTVPQAGANGRPAREVFSCVGDSGGPLIGRDGNGDALVGVVSWSKGCGLAGSPDVYTDVARYARWMDAARARLKSGAYVLVADPPVQGRP